MYKAVFLDRDGVLITEKGIYNYREEDILYPDGIVDALEIMYKKGFLLLVISNQSGIGKGLYTQDEADHINKIIQDHFASFGIPITDFFYCPHHPEMSNCICRKPDSLLFEKAMAIYSIDPTQSYMIGDMDRDMEAAIKAGVHPIKIEANENLVGVVGKIK